MSGYIAYSASLIQSGRAASSIPPRGRPDPGPPAAEVALPPLVHPERPIDAPSRELRQQEIRAETAVPDHYVPRLQGLEHLPEQGRLAGLLPLVGAHGQIANQARPERDQDRQAGDREPLGLASATAAEGRPPGFPACPASRPSCRRRDRLADRSRARIRRLRPRPGGLSRGPAGGRRPWAGDCGRRSRCQSPRHTETSPWNTRQAISRATEARHE